VPDIARAVATPARQRAGYIPERAVELLGTWWPLGLALSSFLVVATVYNVRVPIYEAPDEIAHTRYVTSIAARGELMDLSQIEEYEAWQPPLYYAVGAGVIKLFALDPPQELAINPNFPAQRQNFLHPPEEGFPYSEPEWSIHVLRGLSTIFSLGTIAFIYLTSLAIFPRRKLLAFTAAATAGLVPQFAFISATVSNDAAAVFFAAGTVYFGLTYLKDNRRLWLALAAVALSLGALTKTNALVAGFVPLTAVLISSRTWREKAPLLALFVVLPISVAGWFYLRSLLLWGAIVPAETFLPGQLPVPIWHSFYREVFLEDIRQSFWYVGGPMNLRLSKVVYDSLDLISVLALGGIIAGFVSAGFSRGQRWSLVLLSSLPVLALLSVIYFSLVYAAQNQGRYLFVALTAFAILLPLGLGSLMRRDGDRDHPVMLALPALLLAINISIFTITLPRYY
jgi:hypothetical protein